MSTRALGLALWAVTAAPALDLSSAVVSPTQGPAARMLVEEVERRSGIRWPTAGTAPVRIALSVHSKGAAEGFTIRSEARQVSVMGNDERGLLFGVGRLLRELRIRPGRVELPAGFQLTSAPSYALRGHQLGYRPKTNSYDGWNLSMWEQYIRDLAVFGANAVELIPPRSDDAPDSPHFPLPPMETMIGMSKILDAYGLDVWIWYPALDDDYSNPATVDAAVKEWGEVFRNLPRINAVMVPGGDPGHTPAAELTPFLEKQAANLRRYHPKAGLWVAPQGFDETNLEVFLAAAWKRPAWLAGVVYGPQTRISLPELRRRLPKDMPVRHYPDITHTHTCQYPVPDWDTAHAVTSSREPINPRPIDQARIFRLLQPFTIGFITYSEGCNDDVNKAIWSGLGWNPDAPVLELLREYGRYFIGPDDAGDFAEALLGLERNWRGPARSNEDIPATLMRLQRLERKAPPQLLANWRFQQALYRAYYDAHVQRRLIRETALEDAAKQELATANARGALRAVGAAEAVLDSGSLQPVAPELRARVFQLAEALYQSVRMQLSVRDYKAIGVSRGATLDSFEAPLSNRPWLKERFAHIRGLGTEPERLAEIDRILHWTDPGPGGFYDDLGRPGRQPHLVPGPGFERDPQFFASPLNFFVNRETGPSSWWDQVIGLYDQPLQMRYDNLDPGARYRLRVVYGGGPLRLTADRVHEIHALIQKPYQVLEFDIPPHATADGVLGLEWRRPAGGGGPGRGCQLAEAWLIKVP